MAKTNHKSPPATGFSLDDLERDPAVATTLSDGERQRTVSRLAALVLVVASSTGAPESSTPRVLPVLDDDHLLRVSEAAQVLGFGRSHVYNLISRGELPAIHSGRRVRVRRSSVLEWTRLHESG